jgi:hypothetical protein
MTPENKLFMYQSYDVQLWQRVMLMATQILMLNCKSNDYSDPYVKL